MSAGRSFCGLLATTRAVSANASVKGRCFKFEHAGVQPVNDVRALLGTICNAWYRGRARECSLWTRPLSRLLVVLTTLLLLVMPVTEHLCNWDHFLSGGPDVEFSLLAGLLFAAMVVLSMNGTMLRPAMMRPGTMARCEDRVSSDGSGARPWLGHDRCSPRSTRTAWRALELYASIDAPGSCTPVPMRI